MQNFGLTWVNSDGTPQASAVAYDKPSADQRKTGFESVGSTSVEIVPVRPGELPAVQNSTSGSGTAVV